MPRWVDAQRVTFKYGLGDEFIGILETLHLLQSRVRPRPIRVRSARTARSRSRRATSWPPALPDPATIGPRMTGKTCAGLWVTGTRHRRREPREVYLYHVSDNEWTMAEYESAVRRVADGPEPRSSRSSCWRRGAWSGTGVLGPEAFDARAVPRAHGAPGGGGRLSGQRWGPRRLPA